MKFVRILLFSLLALLICLPLYACSGDGKIEDTTIETKQPTEEESKTEAPTEETTQKETEQTPTETETETVIEETTEEVTTEPEETEEPITDVMIGEVLDAPYASDFTVSNVFASDMVVQRGEHIRVWGYADPSQNGKKISGEFKGMFAEAIIEDGEWVITFGARLEASAEMGNSMRIYTDSKEVVFTDVLVGDVYMVMGQSNCAYSVANHLAVNNTPDKGGLTALDYSAPIRLHYNSLNQTSGYPQRGTDEVCKQVVSGSKWQRADSYADIQNFTAIGYYFAYHYMNITDKKVPIGLIEIDGNGQPLGAFMCNEVANEYKTDRFNDEKGYYVTTGVNANWGRYLYNHYMYPFERYAIAGIIWYQGESDFQLTNTKVFARNFSALMTYMRGTHNLVNKDFPVYFIEFPTQYKMPSGFTPSASAPTWAYMDVGLIRAAMGAIPQVLNNSYQVVSCDLWSDDTYWNSLHPNCKYEQALRAAELASAVLGEGKSMAESTGPILVGIEMSEDKKTAILTYDNVGGGLKTCDGSDKVKGFTALRNGFVTNTKASLEATITAPNQITITSNTTISGLAYNVITTYFYGKELNLCNSYGMPAGAALIYP